MLLSSSPMLHSSSNSPAPVTPSMQLSITTLFRCILTSPAELCLKKIVQMDWSIAASASVDKQWTVPNVSWMISTRLLQEFAWWNEADGNVCLYICFFTFCFVGYFSQTDQIEISFLFSHIYRKPREWWLMLVFKTIKQEMWKKKT